MRASPEFQEPVSCPLPSSSSPLEVASISYKKLVHVPPAFAATAQVTGHWIFLTASGVCFHKSHRTRANEEVVLNGHRTAPPSSSQLYKHRRKRQKCQPSSLSLGRALTTYFASFQSAYLQVLTRSSPLGH